MKGLKSLLLNTKNNIDNTMAEPSTELKVGIELEQTVRQQIYDAIQGPTVEKLISQLSSSASDVYWRSTMEGHSFKVEEKLMKHLYDLFYGVKESLGFKDPVDFYITGDASVNAFSVASEKEGEPNIVNINSALVELMSDAELKFVVGHEIGHLINRDTHHRRLLSFVFPEGTEAPLILRYKMHLDEQLCELVADRYGYLAIPDIETCVSAFFKLSSGLDVSKLDVEVSALIEENKARLDYFLKGEGMSMASHPVNPIRIQALNLFSSCKDRKELDKSMDELIEILLKVGSGEVDKHMPYFIATAGLLVANADDEFTKEEYEQILSNLSGYQMFPKKFLDEVSQQDVVKIFQESASKILEQEPALRDTLFNFVLSLLFADKKFNDKELEFVYELGKNFFGYSEKEISGMFAAMIQAAFTPDIEALC